MEALDIDGRAVVDAIDQPAFVVDGSDRVLVCNEECRALAGDDVSGTSLGDALADYPDLLAEVSASDPGLVTVETSAGTRHFDVQKSDLRDERGRRLGDLVLCHDVTERQRQRRELERQNEQLDRFASLVSHDLRNPLDVAIGRTTVLGELVDSEEAREHVAELEAAHTRMREIIHDVLTLAQKGRNIDETSAVDLAAVAEAAWSHVDTAGASLSVRADATVCADPARLEQVFENLFRNSVEHAATSGRGHPDGDQDRPGSVTVTVGELAGGDGFYVADDGRGVPDDVANSVFEAGVSGDGGGTGLGLAIVRSIAAAHGWKSEVNTAEAGGARFEFRGVELATDGTRPEQ